MDAELREASWNMNLHLARCPQLPFQPERRWGYFIHAIRKFSFSLAMPLHLASQMDEQDEALRRNTPIRTF